MILLFLLSFLVTNCLCSRPNIVMVLTDDQDVFLDGMEPLVQTKKLLGEQGTTFSNAFVTTPVCCPNRASMLTGRHLHNTGTFNNSISGNCGGEAWVNGMEKQGFAVAIQEAGYQTMYAGKYMNMYGLPEAGGLNQVPPGWTSWQGLKGNSKFYNYSLSIDGVEEKHGDNYEEDYLTDLLGRRAAKFLETRDEEKPFLMILGTPASHAPFTPAPQYTKLFSDMVAPRTQAHNEGMGSTKHWFTRMEPQELSQGAINEVDEVFRNRWRTLVSVDDLVFGLVEDLEARGLMENTYFIYTSDHGYHLGQFGMPIDKRQPYEFDIRVPFIIRGPGIGKNMTSGSPVLSIDLAPTFLNMAGLEPHEEMDGVSLLKDINGEFVGRKFLVEYSGEGGEGVDKACSQWDTGDFSWCKAEMDCKCQDTRNNTYTCLRSLTRQEDITYCKFEDDEDFEEFYYNSADPNQIVNLATEIELEGYRSIMKEMAQCRGIDCYYPDIHSLYKDIRFNERRKSQKFVDGVWTKNN